MTIALTLFIVTLILVIWQPRGLSIGWSAIGGAAVALATGVVGLADVAAVWHIVWDATFTFVALIIISLVLDEAGCFEWAALHVARAAGGHGRRLFVLIVLLGAAIAAVFANDGAALLLTPIVIAILLRLDFPPEAALGFIIATGFIADTASLPLVISNLVNIVSANYFDIGFSRYAQVMLPVDLVSIGATLGVLWLAWGRHVSVSYPRARLAKPDSAIVDPAVFRAAGPVLVLLLAAYLALGTYDLPYCLVTGAGALVLLAVAARVWRGGNGTVIALKPVLRDAPWEIVWFSLGMYLIVYGLGQAGLTDRAAGLLVWLSDQGHLVATVGTGVLAALAASVLNNLPATLIGALAVDHASLDATTQQLMIYANVIGNDLGPKFTPIGSLATLLWLHVLAGKGYRIGWGRYMKIGLLLTPPVLVVTLVALALWLPIISKH